MDSVRPTTIIFVAVSALSALGLQAWADDATPHTRAVAAIKQMGGKIGGDKTTGELIPSVEFRRGSKISRDAVSELKGFRDLGSLWFINTGLTDADLAGLQGIKRLRSLRLCSEKKLTDAGTTTLKGLKELQLLDLSGTKITDAGMANLEGLTDLRFLSLGVARITDAGLAPVERLKYLQTLSLQGTRISDAGLTHLEHLRFLRNLNLDGTQVTDAGMVHLNGMSNLERLSLKRTKVTNDRIASLQIVLKDLRVDR
jgi:hypothetical protein